MQSRFSASALLAGGLLVLGAGGAMAGPAFDRLSGASAGQDPCLARAYEPDHMARYPRQRVTHMALRRERVEVADENGPERFTVRVAFRLKGDSDRYATLAVCTTAGAGADCAGEGDTGVFRLELRGDTVRLSIERLEVEGGRGSSPDLAASDDRLFVLRPATAGACRG